MALDQIIGQLRERFVAFATSRGSRDVAEDLAQEVLLVLHEKYPQVTALTELVPLTFQILRYKMLDLYRKNLRRGEYHQESIDDRPLADPGDDPAMQAEQKEWVGQLFEACSHRVFQGGWVYRQRYGHSGRSAETSKSPNLFFWDWQQRQSFFIG